MHTIACLAPRRTWLPLLSLPRVCYLLRRCCRAAATTCLPITCLILPGARHHYHRLSFTFPFHLLTSVHAFTSTTAFHAPAQRRLRHRGLNTYVCGVGSDFLFSMVVGHA